jgi:hypothetical protein
MAYSSRSGRARTSASAPQAHAICDRCGFRYNHVALTWQYDWAGASLINKRILVCPTCLDKPQEQLRAIIVPPDPMPIANPRVEYFVDYESNNRITSQTPTTDQTTGIIAPVGQTRNTEDNNTRSTQMTGEPPTGTNTLPGTDPNAVTYRTVTNAVDNGSGLIRLTLATTNGMITSQRVTVQDVGGVTAASGNWTITVIDNTQIDLQSSSFSGTYTSGGYVVNNPSLPYNFNEVPKTGTL